MTRAKARHIAVKIVKDLFDLGGPTVRRIEFKSGKLGDEKGHGGMCIPAMENWMTDMLIKHINEGTKTNG